jgi:hypothetical protein
VIEDIRRRVERVPFEPFSIHTSDGHEFAVPTIDHVWFPPGGNRVYVADDKGIAALLRPIHIVSITEKQDRIG